MPKDPRTKPALIKIKVVKVPTTGELLDDYYREHGYVHSDRSWLHDASKFDQRASRTARKSQS